MCYHPDCPTAARSAAFIPLDEARKLPGASQSILADAYLIDRPEASCRVFRAYRGIPAHYHEHCSEFLYVLSGRGTFWMEDAGTEAEFGPGHLLCFEKKVIHALPTIIDEPVVFLSIDAPRRIPTDIVFVNPEDGTVDEFMARNAK